jgi:hypothetical protein
MAPAVQRLANGGEAHRKTVKAPAKKNQNLLCPDDMPGKEQKPLWASHDLLYGLHLLSPDCQCHVQLF